MGSGAALDTMMPASGLKVTTPAKASCTGPRVSTWASCVSSVACWAAQMAGCQLMLTKASNRTARQALEARCQGLGQQTGD